MGKIAPPPEVYAEWTPEAQQAYNEPLNEMGSEAVKHHAAADQLESSAAEHQHDADMFQMVIDKDMGKNAGDSAKFDGTMVLAIKYQTQADNERKAAAQERQQATDLESEVERLQVSSPEMSSVDTPKIQQEYADEVKKELESDKAKLSELKKEEESLKQELDDRWFFKGDLEKRLGEVQKQISTLEGDIAFNQQNLNNTFPPPPPPPPVPTSIGRFFVTAGAKLVCPFAMGGMATLVVDPSRKVMLSGKPMANIMDFKLSNIQTFGVCSSMANPQVAAATAAAFGALTPMPCVPNIPAPWAPGKENVLVESFPALLCTDSAQCIWGGKITILPA